MGETVKRVTVRVVVHDAADGCSVVRVVTVQITAAHWRNVNHLQERKGSDGFLPFLEIPHQLTGRVIVKSEVEVFVDDL